MSVTALVSSRLLEQVRAHITRDSVLELGNLVEQIGDDVLGKVALLLLFSEPREVLVLQLQLVELLIEAVERSGVALLVDELLTLGQSLLELDLLLEDS